MKTITINGLVFTDQPPTKEGWYLFSQYSEDDPIEDRNCDNCGVLESKYHPNHFVYIFNDHLGGALVEKGDRRYVGFWHELIPRQVFAEEVEKAYEEGWDSTARYADYDSNWTKSRAKRVAEGKESK